MAWVCAAALAVFVTWVATDESANLGIAFFYAVPVGLAAWWGGARWAVDAVGLAMFIRTRFAAFAAKTSDPAELLSLANTALIEHAGSGRGLVRTIGIRFRAEEAMLSWAVAGHPPALRLPRLGELSPLGVNLPLGVDPDLKLRTAHSSRDPRPQGHRPLGWLELTSPGRYTEPLPRSAASGRTRPIRALRRAAAATPSRRATRSSRCASRTCSAADEVNRRPRWIGARRSSDHAYVSHATRASRTPPTCSSIRKWPASSIQTG